MQVPQSWTALSSWAVGVALALVLVFSASARAATSDGGATDCDTDLACGLDAPLSDSGVAAPEPDGSTQPTMLFFWAVGCPHCEEAKPLVDRLAKEYPQLRVERIEVRNDPAGRQRFIDTMTRLDAAAVGVPTFVVGSAYVVGYAQGTTDEQVRAMVAGAQTPGAGDAGAAPKLVVPWLGAIEPASVSLPGLTLAIGLADGVNPCAIWVLVVLLGILLHVETTKRMMLYAGTFVVMSGVVYFGFMVAWATLFQSPRSSR